MASTLARLFAVTALITSALSLPFAKPDTDCHVRTHKAAHLQTLMPTLTGLPSNSNVTLKYVALGVGHQNYTCNGTAYLQTSAGDGALAYLYDATSYFRFNESTIQSSPSQRLSEFMADGQSQVATDSNPRLPLLGEHFFDAELRPNFNLFGSNPPLYLLAEKIDAVSSPTAGDIAWLYLIANPTAGETNGLQAVYRVETAGGAAPTTCSTAGSALSVPYAAEYWFFD